MNKVSLVGVGGCLLLLAATGCASLPEPQTSANGEPLSVQEKTETYHYTVKKKIGEVEHRDSHGRNAGKSTLYTNQSKTGHYTSWGSYQGDQKITDDDLFAISKDESAIREVHDKRSSGVMWNRIGIGLFLVGVAAVAGGALLYSNAREGADVTLPVGLMIGGAVGLGLGNYFTWSGMSATKEVHPLPQERAEQAADRYNASLGSDSSTTSTTSSSSSSTPKR